MAKLALLVSCCLAAVFSAGDRAVAAASPVVAFRHVTVIDGTGSPPQPDLTVVIADGRIRDLGPAREIKVPEGATAVDASGKFLIPGLTDMHVHVTRSSDQMNGFLSLLVASGVTGVRETSGDLDNAARLRQEIAAGDRLSPWIVSTGPSLDGPAEHGGSGSRPVARGADGARPVASAADGRARVEEYKRRGAEFVKVYSVLSREAYFAIADEARRQKLPLAGHVTVTVSAAEASDAGQKSIEHMAGVLLACSSDEERLRAELDPAQSNPDRGRRHPYQLRRLADLKAADTYSPPKAEALFQRFVKNGTWLVPTLAVLRAIPFLDEASATDPRLRYMQAATWQRWKAGLPWSNVWTAQDWTEGKRLFAKQVELVGALHRARVKLLAGTDMGLPHVFPGFSLHEELALLVGAGLTPMEALQTATRNAAEYLGTLESQGTVEKGKAADLVLLDANPLADIRNTQKIAGVVLRGRLLSRSVLDTILAEVEAAAAKGATSSSPTSGGSPH